MRFASGDHTTEAKEFGGIDATDFKAQLLAA